MQITCETDYTIRCVLLAKKSVNVSLLDVIEAVEGSVSMNICAVDKKLCKQSNSCLVYPVWVDLRKNIENYLKGYSFAHLIMESKK